LKEGTVLEVEPTVLRKAWFFNPDGAFRSNNAVAFSGKTIVGKMLMHQVPSIIYRDFLQMENGERLMISCLAYAANRVTCRVVSIPGKELPSSITDQLLIKTPVLEPA